MSREILSLAGFLCPVTGPKVEKSRPGPGDPGHMFLVAKIRRIWSNIYLYNGNSKTNHREPRAEFDFYIF